MKLTELMEIDILQKIQDSFSKFTGMASITTDPEGVPITVGSGFSEFCMKYTRQGSVLGNRRCEACDKKGAVCTLESGRATTYFCHAGLVDFAAPIMLNDEMIGCFIGGQVRTGPLNESSIREVARELGIDPDEYVEASRKIQLLDRDYINKSARYLEEIAAIISQMAYHNYVALHESMELELNSRAKARYAVQHMIKMKKEILRWNHYFKDIDKEGMPDAFKGILKLVNTKAYDIISDIQDTEEYLNISLGNIQVREEIYNVRDLLEEIKVNTQIRESDAEERCKIEVDPSVPEWLFGDKGRIGMLVSKQLEYGCRFSEDDLMVKVSAEPYGYGVMIYIHVISEKTVIPRPILERMRAGLEQGQTASENSCYHKVEGMTVFGVMAKQMAGEMQVESEEGKGTCFTMSLPQLEIRRNEDDL